MTIEQQLQIQPAGAEPALTPQQARFNTLVREVAQWRAALAQWKDRTERFEQAVGPIRRELHAAWRDWVFALDAASLQPGLARSERAELGEFLRETATALLEADERDAEIASVLARHAPPAVRAGADPGTDTATETEPAVADWEALAEAAAAQREQRAALRRAANLRKRRAQAVQEVSQSLRDVYRKLASALHPDREPDAQQRERKTALMQQANQAHAEGNLLALLELQLEAEQLDAIRLGALEARRLQHYVEVLQEQLDQLQAETRRLEASFRWATGVAPGSGLQPRKADRLITAEAQRLRDELALLRRQARLLLDADMTRNWLRAQRKA